MTLLRLLGKRPLAAALCLSLALAGCGRKGPLDGPPGSNLPKVPKTTSENSGSVAPEAVGAPARGAVIRPKQSFLLDPLL